MGQSTIQIVSISTKWVWSITRVWKINFDKRILESHVKILLIRQTSCVDWFALKRFVDFLWIEIIVYSKDFLKRFSHHFCHLYFHFRFYFNFNSTTLISLKSYEAQNIGFMTISTIQSTFWIVIVSVLSELSLFNFMELKLLNSNTWTRLCTYFSFP